LIRSDPKAIRVIRVIRVNIYTDELRGDLE
jgi:hypothetical protein